MASTPDVGSLLQNQQGYNLWNLNTQLGAGRAGTANPYGTQQWAVDPNTGQWTLNQSFSPAQQGLYDQSTGLAGQGLSAAQGFFRDPRNTSRIEYEGPSYTYNGGSRDAAEKALYSRAERYLAPQYDQQQNQLWDRLQAMGANVSDPAFRTSMDDFYKSRERAFADARDSAIIGGGREATEELQRGLSSEGARTGFLRNERSDMNALYNNLRQGGQPVPGWTTPPTQFGTPGMPSIDAYSAQMANWNAQQAGGANRAAGWWGLGNNFLNSGAGQKLIDIGIGKLGGFFGG